MGFPVPGTAWTMKNTVVVGTFPSSSTMTTYKVLPDIQYKGRQVHRIDMRAQRDNTPQIDLFEKATKNWIGHLTGDRETASALPHTGVFEWPLRVGKSWTAVYTHHGSGVMMRGSPYEDTGLVRTLWSVDSYEDLEVPAGRFKVFKLRSSAAESKTALRGQQITSWYAPAIHIVIRSEGAIRSADGPVVRFVNEVMTFTRPE